jgi:hypothetical protein
MKDSKKGTKGRKGIALIPAIKPETLQVASIIQANGR